MGKTLVILESRSKIPKVQKILGPQFIVKASNGHIRGLHEKELSIDIENDFRPTYIPSKDKKTTIAELKRAAKTCSSIILACDYDREGESISWHLAEVLRIKKTDRKRLLFKEITKSAIEKGIKDLKPLDRSTMKFWLNNFRLKRARARQRQ